MGTKIPARINISLPRDFDWPAALLLMAAMTTAATRLAATRWTTDLMIVQTVTILGVIAGLALGVSRFSGRVAFYLAFAYGLFVIPWQIGLIQQSEALWSQRLLMIGNRLGIIFYQLFNKLTVLDSLLFLVLMSLLFWSLSVYAGYSVARYGDAWKAIVPTGLALFVIHYYDPLIARRAWYLAFFIFLGLMLVARLAFIKDQKRWQSNHTALPPHLSLDFIRFTILFAGAIVLLAWTVPALAQALPAAERLWQPVRNTWNDAVDDLNYAFASLRSTRPVFSPVYGNNAILGRGAPLGNTQIFTVRTPINAPSGVRFYWRARVYDVYENGQWYSSIDLSRDFDPESSDPIIPNGIGRWEGLFQFTSAVQMGTIFTPPQPIWVSRESTLQYLENPDGTLDISSFVARSPIGPGQVYEARASISAPTVLQLQQSGTDYPAWVTSRYLQLPPEITPRTRQLAEEITAGLETPYDKATAITKYLRENITYVETIEGNPAPGQESIDWFLFDLKQGFCNYYATAEVILLRAVGIPARWAIGYAQGQLIEYEAQRELTAEELTYIVRHKDAHSWPEVYFSGIGWVEFEPTVSQPDIQRPSGDLNPLDSANLIDPDREGLEELRNRNQERESPIDSSAPSTNQTKMVYWIAGVLALVCLLLAFGLRFLPIFGFAPAPILFERMLLRFGIQPPEIIQRWADQATSASPPARVIQLSLLPVMIESALLKIGFQPPKFIRYWARYAQLPSLAKAYNEINRALARLGEQPGKNATPTERAARLSSVVPPAAQPAQTLLHEYQIGTFSQKPANLELAAQSAKTIRRLSYRIILKRLLTRLQRPEEDKLMSLRKRK